MCVSVCVYVCVSVCVSVCVYVCGYGCRYMRKVCCLLGLWVFGWCGASVFYDICCIVGVVVSLLCMYRLHVTCTCTDYM